MSRVSNKIVRENRLKVLEYIASQLSDERRAVSLSKRQIVLGVGLSKNQVRSICGYLAQRGYVRSDPCFSEDGGQLANRFSLTPKGWRALRNEGSLVGDDRCVAGGVR